MGGGKSSLARAAAKPAAGARLPPSLHLAGPSMGYFDFFTFSNAAPRVVTQARRSKIGASWVLAFLLMVG
jgi:hypothetical protein